MENLDVDLPGIYAEINEEHMERLISARREQVLRTAISMGNRKYSTPFNLLPHRIQKRLVAEAAEFVEERIIEESQGRIY